jgi:heme-degrading monooxygenase HmoA
MILEIATFDIKEGHQTTFEQTFQAAEAVVSRSKGFISLKFHHCIEIPTKYKVLIHWQTLEDHTIGFRQSALFTEWRTVLSPHFNKAPIAEHFEIL